MLLHRGISFFGLSVFWSPAYIHSLATEETATSVPADRGGCGSDIPGWMRKRAVPRCAPGLAYFHSLYLCISAPRTQSLMLYALRVSHGVLLASLLFSVFVELLRNLDSQSSSLLTFAGFLFVTAEGLHTQVRFIAFLTLSFLFRV